MKNVTVKAVALAIAAASAGYAHAAPFDLDDTTSNPPRVVASQRVTVGGTSATTIGSGALDLIDTTNLLGFGVSNGQTRYIRYDLTNAKFATDVSAADDLNVELVLGGSAVTAKTVASGGAAGGTYVIFQITAPADYGPTNTDVELDLSDIGVKLTAGTSVGVTYSMYETGSAASSGGSSGRLSTVTNTVLALADGLDLDITPATSTADVDDLYTDFVGDVFTTKIGGVSVLATLGVLDTDLSALVITDLVDVDTTMVLTGDDLSAAVEIDGVYVRGSTSCGAGTLYSAENDDWQETNSAEFLTGTAGGDFSFCYDAAGELPISIQDFTVKYDVDAATGSSQGDVGPAGIGNFIHNGTVLKAAFIAPKSGQSTWIQLANTGNRDADYEVTCYKASGADEAGTPGTVLSGTTAKVGFSAMGCPSGTASVVVTLAVPEGTVIGSVVRQNNTTGDTGMDSMTGNQ